MINNGGANANKLIADFLNDVSVDYRLVSFEGGTVPNAITESATAIVLVPFDDIETFMSDFNTYMNDAKEKYKDVDVDMSCDEHPLLGTNHCIPQAAADLLISGVSASPQGVLEWSKVVEGIFEVSSNIGVVLTEDDGWFVRELPRSFTDSKIDAVAQQIAGCFEGAEVELENRYSPWSPDITSPLIVYSQKVYQDINGKPIELFIVGGGVEASAFSVTYPDMQIVCYGPTILDAHTINERVEIATIETCWRYTIYLLGQMAECK
jgi:dipeptidase D